MLVTWIRDAPLIKADGASQNVTYRDKSPSSAYEP